MFPKENPLVQGRAFHLPKGARLKSNAPRVFPESQRMVFLLGFDSAAPARTLGQDEEFCVVYGIPKEAFKLGALGAHRKG